MKLCSILATWLFASTTAWPADPEGPPSLPKDAPKLTRDVTVVAAGSSITMNRYGCREIPAWTGGYDRVPPQTNGQNVFFRIFELLNDHENMCWRRLTDQDWTRQGPWTPEIKLPYNDACYGKRVAYTAKAADDAAELSIPAGFEKIDLIYATDPNGDAIKVTIDGAAPAENALIDTFQDTKLPPTASRTADFNTFDSHGEPLKLSRPVKGIANIIEMRARYRLDPARPHTFKIQRGTTDPDKRILVWGAVYWRGNCAQVVQRSKGGINCGHLPYYHAIQETMALKPDYLLVEAISIRAKLEEMDQTLNAPLAWCGNQTKANRFKTMIYATPMGNSQTFRAWFRDPKHGTKGQNATCADPHADACFAWLEKICKTNNLPLLDVGPTVDAWLKANPRAAFVPHVQADWFHPNQSGAALFAQVLAAGIRQQWPELPVRTINTPIP